MEHLRSSIAGWGSLSTGFAWISLGLSNLGTRLCVMSTGEKWLFLHFKKHPRPLDQSRYERLESTTKPSVLSNGRLCTSLDPLGRATLLGVPLVGYQK